MESVENSRAFVGESIGEIFPFLSAFGQGLKNGVVFAGLDRFSFSVRPEVAGRCPVLITPDIDVEPLCFRIKLGIGIVGSAFASAVTMGEVPFTQVNRLIPRRF